MLTARLGVLALLTLTAAAVSLVTTAFVFDAVSWPTYIAANLLLGFTYGLVGALLAPVFGRVGGVFLAFLLPFLDLGITRSPPRSPSSCPDAAAPAYSSTEPSPPVSTKPAPS